MCSKWLGMSGISIWKGRSAEVVTTGTIRDFHFPGRFVCSTLRSYLFAEDTFYPTRHSCKRLAMPATQGQQSWVARRLCIAPARTACLVLKLLDRRLVPPVSLSGLSLFRSCSLASAHLIISLIFMKLSHRPVPTSQWKGWRQKVKKRPRDNLFCSPETVLSFPCCRTSHMGGQIHSLPQGLFHFQMETFLCF